MSETVQAGNGRLWELTYRDIDRDIRLTAYADTIVCDNENGIRVLVAARFGGYPEQVHAMSDAIYAGGQAIVEMEDSRIYLNGLAKQYRRLFTNDGLYAEAVLLLEGNRKQVKIGGGLEEIDKNPPLQPVYLYCERDSAGNLFEEIDKAVSVPLIPEFQDYLVEELEARGLLARLEVASANPLFDAWRLMLSTGEKEIISVVEHGLETGQIAIPGGQAGTGKFIFGF